MLQTSSGEGVSGFLRVAEYRQRQGAPAKGITLLNYCKIDSDLVEYITEKAPLKIGKYTPGTHIPVVGDEKITDDKPDYALLLSWNFSEEIMKNLRKNQNYQGKFIIPIPHPQIV